MTFELQKRPFARPLFFWITGILLYVAFPERASTLCVLLVVIPVFFLMLGRSKGYLQYESRWTWGLFFALLLVTLSILATHYADERRFLFTEQVGLVKEFAEEEREKILEPVDHLDLSDEEKSVLATITFGYRGSMSWATKQKFSIAGVPHILAVSGFHVAVVCGFLSFLFQYVPRKRVFRCVQYPLMILLLWSYVVITGLAASAVRAGIMLTLYLVGRLLERDSDRYNTLAAAAFCMLAYNPLYLFDIGFELSYLAMLSIFFFFPRLNGLAVVRNPLLKVPWDSLTITLAAQLGTAWLCLYYFGSFSSVFLFANLPVTILATFLIPMVMIWVFLPTGFPLTHLLQVAIEWVVHFMVNVVDLFSSVPGAALHFNVTLPLLIVGYAALLVACFFIVKHRARYLIVMLCLILVGLLYVIAESFFIH